MPRVHSFTKSVRASARVSTPRLASRNGCTELAGLQARASVATHRGYVSARVYIILCASALLPLPAVYFHDCERTEDLAMFTVNYSDT